MSDTAVATVPKVQITVGGKSLEQIPDEALIEQVFQDSADKLILRSDAIEMIGNDRIYAVAVSVLSDSTKFLRDREKAMDDETEPYKSAIKRIKDATNKLIQPVQDAKARLGNLINQFAAKKERERLEAERLQRVEAERIRAEAARLEQERIRLEEEAKKLAEAGQAPPAAVVEQQQALTLQQAELTRAAVEASKVPETAKQEGLAVQTKWTFKVMGENEEQWKANMILALAEHPEFFDLKPKARIIEAYAKANKAGSKCAGLVFYEETKARPT